MFQTNSKDAHTSIILYLAEKPDKVEQKQAALLGGIVLYAK